MFNFPHTLYALLAQKRINLVIAVIVLKARLASGFHFRPIYTPVMLAENLRKLSCSFQINFQNIQWRIL